MPSSIHASATAERNVLTRTTATRSPWVMAMRRFLRNRMVVLALTVLTLLALSAVFAPFLTEFDPLGRDVPNRLSPPTAQNWLGTDALGRDLYTRMLYGGRMSLYLGLASVALSLSLGVTFGLIAGYLGGIVDATIMRLIDLILAFPGILFAIWLVAMLGPGVNQVIFANAIFGLPAFARVVRGSVLAIKNADYVQAARSTGAPGGRIIVSHMLPNVLAPIVVMASFNTSQAILVAASLSFLGLGPQPPMPEWGSLLADGMTYIRNAWWLTVFPGAALTLTVLSSNLVGDGLRDALDPQMVLK
ncbi:ABC transporter permease subunit [bacterium]|nr:ABC transporter permease subunit [bacterium]